MRLEFRPGRRAPNHLADFAIVFEEGALAGLKLVGGAVWRARRAAADDQVPRLFVTLPALRTRDLGRSRYFDLLRSCSRDRNIIRDFRERVLAAFRAEEPNLSERNRRQP